MVEEQVDARARQQRRARALGIGGRAGAVTAIQRCGSALNVNPHFHTLVAEGVFAPQRDGAHRFVPVREPPTDVEVARLLAAVRGRIIRLLRRHAIDLESLAEERSDPLALDSPALAQLQGASVVGRVATGPRAGERVLRLGSDPTAPPVTTGGPRHAHSEGFDLHANVAVRAGEQPAGNGIASALAQRKDARPSSPTRRVSTSAVRTNSAVISMPVTRHP